MLPAVPPEVLGFAIDYVCGKIVDTAGGEIARRSRPIIARVLGRTFGNGGNDLIHGADLDTAQERLRSFMDDVDERVCELERRQALDAERLNDLFARPEVTGAFGAAFDTAMHTDDATMRSTLADLIVERLAAANDSTDALAIRMAIERMRDITPRQLQLLALIAFLRTDWSGGKAQMLPDASKEDYVTWLSRTAVPFMRVDAGFEDFAHLRSLGLINFSDDASSNFTTSSTPPVLYTAHLRFPELVGDQRVARIMQTLSTLSIGDLRETELAYVASCTLTPAGGLVAQRAFTEIVAQQ